MHFTGLVNSFPICLNAATKPSATEPSVSEKQVVKVVCLCLAALGCLNICLLVFSVDLVFYLLACTSCHTSI